MGMMMAGRRKPSIFEQADMNAVMTAQPGGMLPQGAYPAADPMATNPPAYSGIKEPVRPLTPPGQPTGMFGRKPAMTGIGVIDAAPQMPMASASPDLGGFAAPKVGRNWKGEDGKLAGIGRVLGEIGLNVGAMAGVPFAIGTLRERHAQHMADIQGEQWQRRHDLERGEQIADRDYEANKPRYFGGGQDQVRYDPQTNQTETIYDAPTGAEAYAMNFGNPGSPAYQSALQTYALRGWSDEAIANRSALEDQRFENRANLRGMPTYRDTHPRPTAPRAAPQATPNNVLGGILQKAATGGQLNPQEEAMYAVWRDGRRGGGGGGRAGAAAPSMSAKPVSVTSQADVAKLPRGTMFQAPDGKIRIKN